MTRKSDLKIRGTSLKATLQVGKSGLNDNILKELDDQLCKRDLVKIKVLRSFGPQSHWKDEMESMVASLSAELIEIKGGTVLVFRRSNEPSMKRENNKDMK